MRSDFLLLHSPQPDGELLAGLPDSGLLLRTCLRQMWVGWSGSLPARPTGVDSYRGNEAYRFALEVITGLRSGVPGETNVQGQFHRAWETFRDRAPAGEVARLAPLIHQLMNDAREIRQCYLQGIGGASYGSLLRKLIRPARGQRILLIGFGELARSLLPFLANRPVAVWNRRFLPDPPAQISHYFAPDESLAATRWAEHAVLTTPPDAHNDAHWSRHLSESDIRTVVHLGHRRASIANFRVGDVRVFDLDHLFELRQRQTDRRNTQLALARRACIERAGAAPGPRIPLPAGRLVNA